jgi:Na+/H+ antiporter NhaC
MERQKSAPSEWILVALWFVLLAATIYALAIDDNGLFQLMTAVMFLLVGVTLLVQRRLASKRDDN